MKNKTAMVLASFAGDCLALGAHWIYDINQIVQTCGRVDTFIKPGPNSYHSTKLKGDFTHYGDQMLVLLQSLAACQKFDLNDFSQKWQIFFDTYDGYMDGATRKTLAYYEKGRPLESGGSPTPDFGGASRIAPLVYLYSQDLEALITAVRLQTAMTHNDSATLDSAEFFARAAYNILEGASPIHAIEQTAEEFETSPVSMWVEQGLKSKGDDSIQTIGRFGQACETQQVFSGVIHLIATYENDLKEALIQGVMAGGESAARVSMTGMILGAYLGMDSLPQDWLKMNKFSEILNLLEQIQ